MPLVSYAFNRIRFTTATTGTGTITVGSAVAGFRTPAMAGVPDGTELSFFIYDGTDFEHSRGVYTASGTTLARTLLTDTSTGSLLNLSGNAVVVVTPSSNDYNYLLKRDETNLCAFIGGAGNLTFSGAYGNMGMGQNALGAITTGDNNTAVGVNTLIGLTGGSNNIVVGFNALVSVVNGASNTALGTSAAY
jgi:hypothetical protein